MAVFAYKAMDLDAAATAGTIVADTPRAARDQLRERGLSVTQIDEATGGAPRRAGRRSQVEVVAFVRELATLLGAGIPLLDARSVV